MGAYKITPVPQPELSTAQVWDVIGGSEPYVVKCSEFNTEWVCSCKGFKYRKSCKHCDIVQQEITMLSLSGFSQVNRMRCESPTGFNHTLNSWSLSDWMTAATGELGEAANIAKKLNRVRDGIPGNKETEAELRAALKDEIADVFIYLDLLAQSQGFELEAAVREKFNRTSRKMNCSIEC